MGNIQILTDQQKDQIAGGAHGRKGCVAEGAPHDQGVRQGVELLEEISPQQRDRKEDDVLCDRPLGHPFRGCAVVRVIDVLHTVSIIEYLRQNATSFLLIFPEEFCVILGRGFYTEKRSATNVKK